MAREKIVGLCRFSFLGKCDWASTRGQAGKDPELLQKRAEILFDPRRLARRMQAFETLCLPSMAAQTDQDFSFLILVSPELPLEWYRRLQEACKPVPQVRIVMSSERTPCDALRPHLRSFAQEAGRSVLQFRVDDDDALSIHHIARLRAHARRFADLESVAISFPLGVSFGSYEGEPVTFWRSQQPFVGAGAAVRMRAPGRSIFAIDHFQLPRHFISVTDQSVFGHMILRWDEGESIATIRAKFPPWFKAMKPAALEKILADDFPFLIGRDLGFVRRADAPKLDLSGRMPQRDEDALN